MPSLRGRTTCCQVICLEEALGVPSKGPATRRGWHLCPLVANVTLALL